MGNLISFANHSNSPNCEAKIMMESSASAFQNERPQGRGDILRLQLQQRPEGVARECEASKCKSVFFFNVLFIPHIVILRTCVVSFFTVLFDVLRYHSILLYPSIFGSFL